MYDINDYKFAASIMISSIVENAKADAMERPQAQERSVAATPLKVTNTRARLSTAAVSESPLNGSAKSADKLESMLERLKHLYDRNQTEQKEICSALCAHYLITEAREPQDKDEGFSAPIGLIPAFQNNLGSVSGIQSSSKCDDSADNGEFSYSPEGGLAQISKIVDNLSKRLEGAAAMAERVSAQVEDLDLQKERVSETLHVVTRSIYLHSCSSRVASALASNDLATAANHVKMFREAAKTVSTFEEGGFDDSFMSQCETIKEAARQIYASNSDQLDAAISIRDEQGIVDSLRIFGCLGVDALHDAVKKFGEMFANYISEHAQKDREAIENRTSEESTMSASMTNSRPQALLLSKLLNYTSEIMQYAQSMLGPKGSDVNRMYVEALFDTLDRRVDEENDNNVDQHLATLKPPPVVELLIQLHTSCSAEAISLLRTFAKESHLNDYTSGNSFELQESEEDSLKCNHVLNEVALLCQRCESYMRWLEMQGKNLRLLAAHDLNIAETKRTHALEHTSRNSLGKHARKKVARSRASSVESTSSARLAHLNYDENDGNLDPNLAREKWLDSYQQSLMRHELSSGPLAIALQELAARYVALESKVLSLGVEKALEDDSSRSTSLHYHIDQISLAETELITGSNVDHMGRRNSTESLTQDRASISAIRSVNAIERVFGTSHDSGIRRESLLVSSSIEETFALLQHAMVRALRSGSLDLACASINVSISVLSESIINGLETEPIKDEAKALQREYERNAGSLTASSKHSGSMSRNEFLSENSDLSVTADQLTGHDSSRDTVVESLVVSVARSLASNAESVTSTINNLDACGQYCLRLHRMSMEEAKADFESADTTDGTEDSSSGNNNFKKIAICLDGLAGCAEQCGRAVSKAVTALYKSIRLRVLGRLDTMAGVSSTVRYELTEAEYDRVQLQDPFKVEIIEGLACILAPYSLTLCHKAAKIFFGHITSLISAELYARASRRKFNQIGAIKFDTDVRSLVSLLEGLCAGIDMSSHENYHGSDAGSSVVKERSMAQKDYDKGVRAKFAKLSQMAFILALETVDDIEDCWAEGDLASPPISQETLKKIVSMRSDFPSDAAESLCL